MFFNCQTGLIPWTTYSLRLVNVNSFFLLDMLSKFFNILYDEEVITEEAFMSWKQDENPSRQEAKGPALQATSSFFEWLQSATVEGSEN